MHASNGLYLAFSKGHINLKVFIAKVTLAGEEQGTKLEDAVYEHQKLFSLKQGLVEFGMGKSRTYSKHIST